MSPEQVGWDTHIRVRNIRQEAVGETVKTSGRSSHCRSAAQWAEAARPLVCTYTSESKTITTTTKKQPLNVYPSYAAWICMFQEEDTCQTGQVETDLTEVADFCGFCLRLDSWWSGARFTLLSDRKADCRFKKAHTGIHRYSKAALSALFWLHVRRTCCLQFRWTSCKHTAGRRKIRTSEK